MPSSKTRWWLWHFFSQPALARANTVQVRPYMPYVHVFKKTYNALGIRCLYSLRVDYTSQNSYEFTHCLRLLRDLAIYIAILPDRAFWSKKAYPGAAQYHIESLLEQVDPDEYTSTTEKQSLQDHKLERSQTVQLPIQRFLQTSAPI